jgi:acyl carrier protein
LPDYMAPEVYVVLSAMPLTPNGKIDRKALPEPDSSVAQRAEVHVAPRDPIEERIAAIFGQALGLARVGVLDNFFELGGHSLTATQVVARIRSDLQVELPLRTLFEAPTVAGLAEHVAQRIARPGLAIEHRLDDQPGASPSSQRRTLQRVTLDQDGFGSALPITARTES